MTASSSPRLSATRGKSDANRHPFDAGSTASATTFTIPTSPPTLFSALRSLYMFISNNPQERGAVAPRAFIDKLRELNELFRSNMHQDAHEFLNYLLNQITEEIQKDPNHKDPEFNASGEDCEPPPVPDKRHCEMNNVTDRVLSVYINSNIVLDCANHCTFSLRFKSCR
ncbi:hypothetical protein EWM64_g9753 [Hericium alpestre]|uniref:Peptidase C19 ubiquitin carboxyl-terminal hydrolase domain-containing protein n=1 Tax=Hericium alpestre TaxID=135208 RepID=A0A4Y9ZLF6_9AGAM|nr:hypothetical protein EWM64_g9753 [Hericium alpestre]